jgi:hypothetical protein
MNSFDLMGGVELSLGAAIVVTTVSAVMGHSGRQRLKYFAVLAGWFAVVGLVTWAAETRYQNGIGAPGIGAALAAPMILVWAGVMRSPSLRAGLEDAPLAVLAGVNVIRVLGVNFLILQALARLPAPFAPSAGWGDIVTGLAAIPVAWMVYRRSRGWRAALMGWNLFGLADLAVAISLGVLSAPGPLRRIFAEPGTGLMSTLPWVLIPGFLVPLFAMTHLAIFYRLMKEARSRGEGALGHAA